MLPFSFGPIFEYLSSMANTVSFTFASNGDSTTISALDTTTYTSPTRGNCGVFGKFFKVDFRGSETPLTTTGNDGDPETDVSFTATYVADGHIRFKYIAPPDYSGGTTYAQYAVVYDEGTSSVYRSKSGGNVGNAVSNPTFWEPISDPTSLVDNEGTASESANADVFVGNSIFYDGLQYKRDQAAIDGSTEQDLDAERNKDVDQFRLLDIFVEGIKVAQAESQYNKGERIARRGEAI